MFNSHGLEEKWQPILEHEDMPKIKDNYRRGVTAVCLENNVQFLEELAVNDAPSATFDADSTTSGGDVKGYNPILISLVRRAMPNLIAYDLIGVQPMSGPTGLIFAMKSRYDSQAGTEALFNEADTDFSGTGTHDANSGNPLDTGTSGAGSDRYGHSAPLGVSSAVAGNVVGEGLTTATGEGSITAQMAFSIDRVSVTAKTRMLKAEYTQELAQDLKAQHGLDAETELANILSSEILAEINREVIRRINICAKQGAQWGTSVLGTFNLDTDSNGRWMKEKFQGMQFHMEREANAIARETRRGKGNWVLCSADVASALGIAGILNYTPAFQNNLEVDDTGNTLAGTLLNGMKVYIDPYFLGNASNEYMTIGYRGGDSIDAGMFYCPYVPLQMVRATDEQTFQPKIAFKTRYGLVNNPFVGVGDAADPTDPASVNGNQYFRTVRILNLM
jgi:hypothetical protein